MAERLIMVDLNFGGIAKVVGLQDGTSDDHAATVRQLNAAVEGLAWKDSVRVRPGGNINIASPGASLDGIAMAVGDRVLLSVQTAGAENGIYIWNGAAVPMTRAPDMNSAAEVEQALTTVEEGTSAGATYRQTAVNVTLGTTALSWTIFGTSAGAASDTAAGIIEIATQAEVNAGSSAVLAVTPATLAGWTGKALRYGADFGDGSATSFTITHNLNSLDVHVVVFRKSDGVELLCTVEHTTVNTVTLRFNSAPASNAFRASVAY